MGPLGKRGSAGAPSRLPQGPLMLLVAREGGNINLGGHAHKVVLHERLGVALGTALVRWQVALITPGGFFKCFKALTLLSQAPSGAFIGSPGVEGLPCALGDSPDPRCTQGPRPQVHPGLNLCYRRAPGPPTAKGNQGCALRAPLHMGSRKSLGAISFMSCQLGGGGVLQLVKQEMVSPLSPCDHIWG